PRSSAAARYHLDRQLRQNPARFIRSTFCTSVRSRRCCTRRRKAAASSSMRVWWSMSVLLSAHREYLESLQRLGHHHIDHCLERLVLAGARGQRCIIGSELAMGARAPFQDLARLFDLAAAVKGFLVLGGQLDHLFEQFGVGNDLALAEIDQALIEAIALR